MTARRTSLATASLLLVASVSSAQTTDSIPRLVADVRGASVGLPTSAGWTPLVPTGTEVPSRALGFEVGAHLRVARVGPISVGIGAAYLTARGTATPAPPEPTTTPPTPLPDVSTRLTTIAPQLSLNFGRRLGWSYLSVGLGQGRVRSEASGPASPATPPMVDREWSRTLNYGAGARWFITDRFGVGFDLRWHQLAAVSAAPSTPAAPRQTMFTAGVGISLQ
ncbi:MAG: outer membrane beta-barrel protein [Acidobacteria bacterium]|nr:outer membrane beta-barrel protein [Acidobacteriota bacterium]